MIIFSNISDHVWIIRKHLSGRLIPIYGQSRPKTLVGFSRWMGTLWWMLHSRTESLHLNCSDHSTSFIPVSHERIPVELRWPLQTRGFWKLVSLDGGLGIMSKQISSYQVLLIWYRAETCMIFSWQVAPFITLLSLPELCFIPPLRCTHFAISCYCKAQTINFGKRSSCIILRCELPPLTTFYSFIHISFPVSLDKIRRGFSWPAEAFSRATKSTGDLVLYLWRIRNLPRDLPQKALT